jgi:H+/Cl- antiporter ClcA
MEKTTKYSFEHWKILQYLVKWILLAFPVALLAGSLVALFLWLLDEVTKLRWQNEWLLYLLPLAGVAIYFLYKKIGKNSEAGNNLILDEIHQPGAGVPARMAPLVLLTTIGTHLFGGSAGREGTALQIGGSMAHWLGKKLQLSKADMRILLMTGIAAGFGAVFGTPVTGAIFALEVLAIGRIRYDALLPCFIASILADIICTSWGIKHTHYHISSVAEQIKTFGFIPFDLVFLLKVVIAGIAFGLASFAFAELSHLIKDNSNKFIKTKWLIPFIGGVIIIALTFLAGTTDYLGLGVTSKDPEGFSIVNAFNQNGVDSWSWLWKIVFTAITLGMGFKGGEVTPLFFIGAALGNTLAVLLGAPVDLFAGLGFIAVFAGATNTPLACTLMGVELFGTTHVLYFGIACFLAYYFSGHTGIYQSQLISVSKHLPFESEEEQTLKQHKHEKKIRK